ncbi:hypothetical protein ACTQWG_18150 [Blautia sp. HCP3S3_H10_1]|uniref:hypothetical protein n=1 Tax=unclassified Blautia TaxID=2648079 RepID=UPI003F8EBDEF
MRYLKVEEMQLIYWFGCPNLKNTKERLRSVALLATKYSLQGTTQGRYLTGGVPPVRFSM